MIWRKTVSTPQRSLLWPVSWNCSEYYTALALQPLCNCKGWRKKYTLEFECMKTCHLSTWQQGKFNGNVWIHSCLIFMMCGLIYPVLVSSALSSSVEILGQRRTENMTHTSGKIKNCCCLLLLGKTLLFNLATLVDLISELTVITRKSAVFYSVSCIDFCVIWFERLKT